MMRPGSSPTCSPGSTERAGRDVVTAPTPDAFRAAMSQFASGVTVASTVLDGIDHAMTASAFTSVSLDPPLVLVCVEKSTRFHHAITMTRRWGVSVLGHEQVDVARWLATRGRPLAGQLDGVPHRRGERTGVALVEDALCWVECRTWQSCAGGDHTIVVGEVLGLDVHQSASLPLLYFRGGFTDLIAPEATSPSVVRAARPAG